jgi:hypothetical protein
MLKRVSRCCLLFALAIAARLIAPGPACASSLTIDPQDANLMYDSYTGIQWLRLTQTDGMSYNQVTAAIVNPSSPLYGFTVASAAQAAQLYVDAGIPAGVTSENFTTNSPYAAAIADLTNKWGPYHDPGSDYYCVNAMLADDVGSQLHPEASAAYSATYHETIFGTGWWGQYPTETSPSVGTALIRSIPEPSTAALLAVALIGLYRFARRPSCPRRAAGGEG